MATSCPPKGISERIIRLAKKAGVKLSMHSLRRGFGCRYAGKVSAHVLQRLMRHANIATTMNYYANIDAAVEDAVLGAECNSLCNTPAPGQLEALPVRPSTADVTPCQN